MPVILHKIGKIFDPTDHVLPAGCFAFAQGPQALEFGTFVRVYFSCRAREPDGRSFHSHVAWVDMSKDFSRVLDVAEEVAIAPGGLGAFDEHGIFPMNVLRHEGRILAYTCGWNRRVSVSVDTAIGLAESFDGGRTFERYDTGPVLGPSLREPFLVGDACVVATGDGLRMWYMFGQRWIREHPESAPDRVYKIGQATSADGISWVKQDGVRILPDRLGPDECQALPSVLRFGGVWHMVFCYRDVHGFREDPDRGYRIGYARSDDLRVWERDDDAFGLHGGAGEEWDARMQCYPHLTVSDGSPYLLYNGNAFGRTGFGVAALDLG